MSVIQTKLNPRSPDFKAGREAMSALVSDLRAKIGLIGKGGGEAAREKHISRGLITALGQERGARFVQTTSEIRPQQIACPIASAALYA
jgi:hypothetical protein